VRVLDELVTDFIIELCHTAALSSQLAHRAKIKPDDFKFALRKDAKKLGRVTEMHEKDKQIKEAKKALREEVVAEGLVAESKKGKGKGKRGREQEEGSDGEGVKKKAKKSKKGRSLVKNEDDEGDDDD